MAENVRLCRSVFLRENDFNKIKNKAKRDRLYDNMSWKPIDMTYIGVQCILMMFSDPTAKSQHTCPVFNWAELHNPMFHCASKENLDLILLADFFIYKNQHKLFNMSFAKYIFDIEDTKVTIKYRRRSSSYVLGVGVFEKTLPRVKHSKFK